LHKLSKISDAHRNVESEAAMCLEKDKDKCSEHKEKQQTRHRLKWDIQL